MFNKAPLIVHVSELDWNAYGDPTAHSKFLFDILKRQGGVAEGTPPGTYTFNVKFKRMRFHAELLPM